LELVDNGYVLQMDGQGIASDLDRAIRDLHDPKNSIRRDARIEIMEL
jgi:hypothetical protein